MFIENLHHTFNENCHIPSVSPSACCQSFYDLFWYISLNTIWSCYLLALETLSTGFFYSRRDFNLRTPAAYTQPLLFSVVGLYHTCCWLQVVSVCLNKDFQILFTAEPSCTLKKFLFSLEFIIISHRWLASFCWHLSWIIPNFQVELQNLIWSARYSEGFLLDHLGLGSPLDFQCINFFIFVWCEWNWNHALHTFCFYWAIQSQASLMTKNVLFGEHIVFHRMNTP